VTNDGIPLKYGIQPAVAFIPFAPLAVKAFHTLMPLKWVGLFTVLQTISLLSFYSNFIANDFFWCLSAVCVYILIAMPVYMKIAKKVVVNNEGHQELVFTNLFRKCAQAVFSDYRISLLSKIPLALQVLAGGSLLYGVFGADWILHALAGFGIGILALKAYTIGVGYYGYSRLASYFRISRFHTFKAERKTASAEFTLFSIVVIALVWEVLERTVHYISPVNVFRFGGESLWNTCGDIFFAVIAGMIAWYLFTHKLKWINSAME
jgi:hypothetical protein